MPDQKQGFSPGPHATRERRPERSPPRVPGARTPGDQNSNFRAASLRLLGSSGADSKPIGLITSQASPWARRPLSHRVGVTRGTHMRDASLSMRPGDSADQGGGRKGAASVDPTRTRHTPGAFPIIRRRRRIPVAGSGPPAAAISGGAGRVPRSRPHVYFLAGKALRSQIRIIKLEAFGPATAPSLDRSWASQAGPPSGRALDLIPEPAVAVLGDGVLTSEIQAAGGPSHSTSHRPCVDAGTACLGWSTRLGWRVRRARRGPQRYGHRRLACGSLLVEPKGRSSERMHIGGEP